MASALHPYTRSTTWDEAVREFLDNVKATRAPKTARFYDIQLRQLVLWADENRIPFEGFRKGDMDRYLIYRQQQGKAPTTLGHDAVAAKAFLKWCARNDLLDRNPLGEYQVRNTPRPPQYMPTEQDVIVQLQTLRDHWNIAKNPDMKFFPPGKRAFHRDRNYAILLGLLDTACRIGEMLNLKMDDVKFKERQVLVRQSKGQEPRTLPVSPEWLEALEAWLKVRKRVLADVP
jgi:integrase/recombinase XerD